MAAMIGRRRIVGAALAIPASAWLSPARVLAQTCGVITAKQTEGPFFKPRSPQRITLIEPGATAPRLVVSGRVMTRECKPLKGALLDFWHADEHGDYDNRGYRYRGHQFSDADGRYRLETIVPAVYPGRTRHIHVKVQPAGGRILTTQLYFPNEPQNARDELFRSELTLQMTERGAGAFDFVVA
jgi:protocatechuate 3,4-dioxygenase beta subunit